MTPVAIDNPVVLKTTLEIASPSPPGTTGAGPNDPNWEREEILKDLKVEHVTVHDGRAVGEIGGSITSADLSRTIEGASTIDFTVRDQHRKLAKGGLLDVKARVKLDTLEFALAHDSKTGNDYGLTFEDLCVNALRHKWGPKKGIRGKMTRAEFIRSLVREIKSPEIKFFSPDLHKDQPIASQKKRKVKKTKQAQRSYGFGPGSKFKIKTEWASATQKNILERVLDTGVSMGATKTVLITGVMVVIGESDVSLLNSPNGYGPFSQLRNGAWPASVTDVEADAHAFFKVAIRLQKVHPMPEWQLAHAVQRNADPNFYKPYHDHAKFIVEEYGHGNTFGSTTGNLSATVNVPYAFEVKKHENYWNAIQRLAGEVQWRAFVHNGTLYFASEERLISSKPVLDLTEDDPAVDTIDYERDEGHRYQEASVTCHASRWIAPPGSVVTVRDEGGANGRWLVHTIERSLFSRTTTISLTRAMKELPEPAPEQKTITTTSALGSSGPGGALSGQGNVDKAYTKAREISQRHLPYTWGGGHGSFAPGPGYDCSGYVSACLHAGGMLSSPQTTGGLIGWGHPGRGKFLTVWVKSEGTMNDHCFMEFNMPGKPIQHFGTGRWGTASSGPGYKPQLHTHVGFHPRHWPGT